MTAPTTTAGTVPVEVIGEQAAALRAGLALLAMVDTVPLSLSVDTHRDMDPRVSLGVMIDIRDDRRCNREGERLSGFRIVAETLGLAVDAYEGISSRGPYMSVSARTDIVGVPIRFWLHLTDSDVIDAARRAFGAAEVAA